MNITQLLVSSSQWVPSQVAVEYNFFREKLQIETKRMSLPNLNKVSLKQLKSLQAVLKEFQ